MFNLNTNLNVMNGNELFKCSRKDNLVFLDANRCRYNPCLNGGTCVSNGDGTNHCECVEGFQGLHCNKIQMFGLEYVVVKYDSKAWTDAQADCVQRGYNLASVISLEEAELLETFS